MKTDYRSQWPGAKEPQHPDVSPEMRIGQLKYDLRQCHTTIRTLEWLCFLEAVIIIAICVF